MASRNVRNADLAQLETLLRGAPNGLSLEDIAARLSPPLAQRTLVRRLQALVDRGSVTKVGKRRAARYVAVLPSTVADQAPPQAQPDHALPISPAGAAIVADVTRPLTARKPVGYERAFLDGYRPNVTSYLTASEKKHLATLGLTSLPAGPAGTHAQQILQRLLIDLSWNSSRLEGNTYSLLDTERLIDLGEAADGKSPTDAQMILNHKAAIEFLVQSASEISFNRRTVLNLHALLSENLLDDPRSEGRLRRKGVGISGSVFHPLENPALIEEAFDQILATAQAITDPFEQSLFVMVQLPYLQPFDDVNKRVSRLAANIPFIRHNLSPLSFVDVPDQTYVQGMLGVYELNRVDLIKDVFLWAYERSAHRYAAIRKVIGEPDQFRLRHRTALKTVVAEVVRALMDKKAAAKHVAAWSTANITATDRPRFVEVAETELMALHEGNFARFQLRPSEFDAWQEIWAKPYKARKSTK